MIRTSDKEHHCLLYPSPRSNLIRLMFGLLLKGEEWIHCPAFRGMDAVGRQKNKKIGYNIGRIVNKQLVSLLVCLFVSYIRGSPVSDLKKKGQQHCIFSPIHGNFLGNQKKGTSNDHSFLCVKLTGKLALNEIFVFSHFQVSFLNPVFQILHV